MNPIFPTTMKFLTHALLAFTLMTTAAANAQERPDKVGIFDLKAIHSVPLNPEVIGKTKKGNLVFEEVRFTSVPGVRVYAILSYKEGAKKLPGIMVVDRFKAKAKEVEATNNYFAISVAPPDGNQDPKKKDSVGGPNLKQPFSLDDQFTTDPTKSYIYHHTVALIRALDYMETRPEVEVSKTVVTGYSWPGLMVSLLNCLDDRPCAFVLWHGLGYYADENGKSGDGPAKYSRRAYEMYGSGAYVQYAKKPVYVGVALNDYFTQLDSIMAFYNGHKGEKAFVYAPNRHHRNTARNEFNGAYPWQTYWQLGAEKPSTIGEGQVTSEDGKIHYTCNVETKVPLTTAEALVSYGKPGNWLGRTWQSVPLKKVGESYQAEIPVYDPAIPFYVIGQIATAKHSFVGNGPQFVDPALLGLTESNSKVSNILFDPSLKSDFYLRTGVPNFVADGPLGKGSAIITVDEAGMVMFQNFNPQLWKGAKELSIYLKGDGKVGPLSAYVSVDGGYYIDKSTNKYTQIKLVPEGAAMPAGWKEYVIPLSKVANLNRAGTLYFEPGNHTLQVGVISWR